MGKQQGKSLKQLPQMVGVAEQAHEDDSDFVQQCRLLVKNQRQGRMGGLVWISLAIVAGFIVWAGWAELEEVTRGAGKVVPSTSVQMIQSLEGGILDEIFVNEGDEVGEGRELLRISDTIFEATYQENIAKRDILEARLSRLRAEAEGSSRIESANPIRPDLAEYQRELFEARRRDVEATRTSLAALRELAKEEEVLLSGGENTGAISPLELLKVKKEIAEIDGKLDSLETSIRREAMEQLEKDNSDLEVLLQTLRKDKDRLDRTVIQSPVRGTVNKIYIDTVGRVIGSGVDILEIVPLDDSLLIEVNVLPADIAFLRPEQEATVKFTAYDFAIYGGLKGSIEQIGADTITNEEGESFYQIKVRTEENTLGKDRHGEELVIIPGMVAEVDIITGKKSVLNYLLKPLTRARERALREK